MKKTYLLCLLASGAAAANTYTKEAGQYCTAFVVGDSTVHSTVEAGQAACDAEPSCTGVAVQGFPTHPSECDTWSEGFRLCGGEISGSGDGRCVWSVDADTGDSDQCITDIPTDGTNAVMIRFFAFDSSISEGEQGDLCPTACDDSTHNGVDQWFAIDQGDGYCHQWPGAARKNSMTQGQCGGDGDSYQWDQYAGQCDCNFGATTKHAYVSKCVIDTISPEGGLCAQIIDYAGCDTDTGSSSWGFVASGEDVYRCSADMSLCQKTSAAAKGQWTITTLPDGLSPGQAESFTHTVTSGTWSVSADQTKLSFSDNGSVSYDLPLECDCGTGK